MRRVTYIAMLALGMLIACVKDPVTGKRELVLIGESEEIAMGRQGSADVEASMGLYQDTELSAYVEELGQSMAQDIYEILGLTRRNAIKRYAPMFQDVIESFDRLRDRSALEIQPRRIHWVQASRNVTLREALLEAGADSDELDDLAVLNNLGLDESLTKGQWIKVLEGVSP